MSTDQLPAAERELRYAVAPITDITFRDATATGDGSWLIEGYAAVYDAETTLYDGKFYQLTESIAPGAFANVLARVNLPASDLTRTLVHLNYVHDMQSAVAATDADGPIGRLLLAEDARGLRFTAKVDREDPDAVRMAVKMRRGVVRQASFAFTIAAEESLETETEQKTVEHTRILEIKDLYDVCVCPQGAYPQTVSTLRSLAAAIGRTPDEGVGHLRRPQDGGASTITELGVDVATSDFDRAKARLQAHAKSRRVKTSHTKGT